MNTLFAAQKAAVPIDVALLAGPDAPFLQQAAHLTGGTYYRLGRRGGVLQYLMVAFLAGVGARRGLVGARQEAVDLRAACFCHGRVVEVGYVCSVCLSSELVLFVTGCPFARPLVRSFVRVFAVVVRFVLLLALS